MAVRLRVRGPFFFGRTRNPLDPRLFLNSELLLLFIIIYLFIYSLFIIYFNFFNVSRIDRSDGLTMICHTWSGAKSTIDCRSSLFFSLFLLAVVEPAVTCGFPTFGVS